MAEETIRSFRFELVDANDEPIKVRISINGKGRTIRAQYQDARRQVLSYIRSISALNVADDDSDKLT